MDLSANHKPISKFPFPEHDIDPKKKDEKEYCLQFAKAIWSRYVSGSMGLTYGDDKKFNNLRAYGQGDQDTDIYQEWFTGKKNASKQNQKNFINISKSVFSPVMKFKSYVKQRSLRMTGRPRVKAIDQMSGLEKQDKEANAIFFMNEGDFVEKVEQFTGQRLQRPEFIPSSIEEMEVFKNATGGFKAKGEIAYTYAVAFTEMISEFPELADQMLDDLMDIKMCGARDVIDPTDGKVYQKYLDPAKVVGFYTRSKGFRDSPAFGNYEDMTLQDLKMATGWSDKILDSIAKTYTETTQTSAAQETRRDVQSDDGKWAYDDIRITVFHCEYLTVNSHYYVDHTTRRGDKRFYADDFGKMRDTETKKTVVNPVHMWYKCSWIVGTDHVYDFGKCSNIPRPDKSKPRSSYHLYKIPGKSFTESIIPSLDSIQLAFIKMQNALAKAPPDGLAIDYATLENINLGDGTLKPIDLIHLRQINGNYIYKSTTHTGQWNGNQKPVFPIEGGAGKLLQEAIQQMEFHFNLIAEISGIDRHSIGVLPNSGETTATASANAATGTGLVILDLVKGLNKVRETLALNCAYRIALLVRHSEEAYNLYHPSLGTANLEILKLTADMTPEQMGIEMVVEPDDEEKRDIHEAALASLRQKESGAPGLEFTDYLFIKEQMRQGNLDFARAYMSMKIARDKEQHEKITMMKNEQQGKLNAQVAQAKSQGDMQLEDKKHQNKIAQINAESAARSKEIELQGIEDRKTERMKLQMSAGNELGKQMIEDEREERRLEQERQIAAENQTAAPAVTQ